MRSISSAEPARNVNTIRESVLAPGAEPVAVPHDNIPEAAATSFKDDHDLLRKTRFAGKLADLPKEDLAFLAAIGERSR